MIKPNKRTTRTAAIVALLIAAAVLCRSVGKTYSPLGNELAWLRAGIYIGLFAAWGVSIRRRIIQTQARRYLTAISALMVFWMAVRTIKFIFAEGLVLIRYLWYLYYIPMLLIPLMALMVALSLGRPESYRLPKWTKLLFVPTAALLLLVLTNDLHQLVFAFPADAAVWTDSEYSYAVCYWLVIGWEISCALAALVTMLFKCRIPSSRKMLWLPLLPLATVLLYGFAYVAYIPWLRVIAGDITVFFCLLFAAVLESCIQCGLIQSNTHYRELFEITGIRAKIADGDYNILLSSADTATLLKDAMRQTEGAPVLLDGGIRLCGAPIKCGHVLWSEDVSQLASLMQELDRTHEQLKKENATLREELETSSRRQHLAEHNRLYDKMQAQTEGWLQLITELVETLVSTGDSQAEKKLLMKLAVLGVYIKRRNNLIFLSEDQSALPAEELLLCFRESIQSLTLFSVTAECVFTAEGKLPFEQTMQLYDMFERVLEFSLNSLTALFLSLTAENGSPVMAMRICSPADMTALSGAGFAVLNEDTDEWLLTYHTAAGGGAI